MKSSLSRIFFLVSFFCFETKLLAQLPAAPAIATSNVPEASQYGVLYELNLPLSANYTNLASVLYSVNNSSLTLNYARVAYFFQLDSKWVWVSMNKFNTTNAQLGVPYNNSGIIYQQIVTGMNVYSSAGAGVTNTTGVNGNIEIWPDCYDVGAALAGIGGNAGVYDFNDTRSPGSNCYGSLQVHNYGAAQTIFAINHFNGGTLDLGIGNNTGNTHPDWTFMSNAGSYTSVRKIMVLVQNGISFVNPPSAAAKNACLNGTTTALSVSTSVSSGTITNYQWYSAITATNSGGTLVATHTTSLTTDSYTPATTAAGTLYYYCVANGSNSFVTTSSVSGAYTVVNPTISISGTGSICAGGSISLSAISAAGPTTYTWSSGASTSSILISPTITSSYSVSATTSIGCVALSSPVTVTVNAVPVISVANGTICSGASFVLSPSGASTYSYSGGSSTVSPTANTNYTVSGTSPEGCIGANSSVSVVVNSLPIISITGTNAICSGVTASLTANGASSYTWNTGSNANILSVSPGSNTSYSVSGTSVAGCLSAVSAVANLTVFALPTLSIAGTNTVCAGASVGLTASGAASYTWSNGAFTSSISAVPSTNTNFSVSGTSANGCVSAASAVKTVSVIALPILTISGNTAICAGASTTLTAVGANTYSWSTGSNAAFISVSPSSNTNYSVTGTSPEGCISAASAVRGVSVNPLPIISITGTNAICFGGSANLTANGASTYTWNTSATATSISVSPLATTNYSVNGTSAAGCMSSSSAVKSVTVYALPTLSIASVNSVCAGASLALTASGASTYTWNNGSTTAVINLTPTATSGYSVMGTNVNGCVSSSSAVKTISVINLPVMSITGNSLICSGATTTLTAGGANTYTWSNGSNGVSVSLSPSITTNYSVSGSNAEGCLSSIAAVSAVSVNPLPIISITGTNAICAGGSANLTANGASTYTWNTNSTNSVISVNPSNNSTYSVSGTSANGCVSAGSAITNVTVYALPVLSITGANTVCEGAALMLNANGATTYTWNTGAFTASVSVTPSVVTAYSVSGTSANGCVSAASAVITTSVLSLPTLSITGLNAMCVGETLSLTASGANTYTWSTNSNGNGIGVSPTVNTTYSVMGTSVEGCLSAAAAEQSITVNPLPTIVISGTPQIICAGETTSLMANGAGTYTWVTLGTSSLIAVSPSVTSSYTLSGTSALGCVGFPVVSTITVNPLPLTSISGTTSTCEGSNNLLTASGAASYSWTGLGSSLQITVAPSSTTSYTLTGTSVDGCQQIAIHTISVNPLPTLTISGSTGLCTGQNATLNVNGANTYSWNTGSTSNSIVTTPTVNTVYTVTGTDLFGCVTTNTQLVTVAATLSVTISGPSTICVGDPLSLNASGAATYTWNTNELTQVIVPSPSVTTTYSVIGASGTCSNIALKTVVVNLNPTLSINGLSTICLGDSTSLTVSGANTYTWSNNSSDSTLTFNPNSTTQYSVVGQYTTGCSGSAFATIVVNALPVVTLSGDSILCSGSSLVLTANGANTYTWNTSVTGNSISVSPQSNSSYAVLGTDTNGCVNSSGISNVTVNPVPLVNIVGSSAAICVGDSVTLTVSGADTYLWNDSTIATLVVYTPNVSTSYSVTGTNNFACSSSTQIAITVNALPLIAISGPSVICVNESGSLSATGAFSYTWASGEVDSILVINPSQTSTYSITGTNAEGCQLTVSTTVEVDDCTGLRSQTRSNTVRVYPNPSSDNITVELADGTDAMITVRNVLGQVVQTQKAEAITRVELQSLNKGLYYITITKNNELVYSTSLIKN